MERNNDEVSLTDINTESQSNIEISGTESVIMDDVATVSYTHLDVYKRQV